MYQCHSILVELNTGTASRLKSVYRQALVVLPAAAPPPPERMRSKKLALLRSATVLRAEQEKRLSQLKLC